MSDDNNNNSDDNNNSDYDYDDDSCLTEGHERDMMESLGKAFKGLLDALSNASGSSMGMGMGMGIDMSDEALEALSPKERHQAEQHQRFLSANRVCLDRMGEAIGLDRSAIKEIATIIEPCMFQFITIKRADKEERENSNLGELFEAFVMASACIHKETREPITLEGFFKDTLSEVKIVPSFEARAIKLKEHKDTGENPPLLSWYLYEFLIGISNDIALATSNRVVEGFGLGMTIGEAKQQPNESLQDYRDRRTKAVQDKRSNLDEYFCNMTVDVLEKIDGFVVQSQAFQTILEDKSSTDFSHSGNSDSENYH